MTHRPTPASGSRSRPEIGPPPGAGKNSACLAISPAWRSPAAAAHRPRRRSKRTGCPGPWRSFSSRAVCVERGQEAGHVGVPGDGPARRGRDQVAIRGRTGQSGAPRDLPSQRSGSRRVARGRCDRVLMPARKPPKTQSGLDPSRTRCGRDCATEPSPARPVRAPGPSRILLRCRPHQMRPLGVQRVAAAWGMSSMLASARMPRILRGLRASRRVGGSAAGPRLPAQPTAGVSPGR